MEIYQKQYSLTSIIGETHSRYLKMSSGLNMAMNYQHNKRVFGVMAFYVLGFVFARWLMESVWPLGCIREVLQHN